MDKIIFDFENGVIEINNQAQQAVYNDPELKDRKHAILEAGGLHMEDFTNIKEMFENYMNGLLSKEDLNTLIENELNEDYNS